jgi:enoyl-CoA hydratase/carnithine racemase
MGYKTISYEADSRIAIITFNRPERLNAFSLELRDEVADAVAKADRDADIRVIVVTGAVPAERTDVEPAGQD